MPPALHSLQPVVALLLSAQSTTVLQYEVALLYRLVGDYPVPNSIINVDAFKGGLVHSHFAVPFGLLLGCHLCPSGAQHHWLASGQRWLPSRKYKFSLEDTVLFNELSTQNVTDYKGEQSEYEKSNECQIKWMSNQMNGKWMCRIKWMSNENVESNECQMSINRVCTGPGNPGKSWNFRK